MKFVLAFAASLLLPFAALAEQPESLTPGAGVVTAKSTPGPADPPGNPTTAIDSGEGTETAETAGADPQND